VSRRKVIKGKLKVVLLLSTGIACSFSDSQFPHKLSLFEGLTGTREEHARDFLRQSTSSVAKELSLIFPPTQVRSSNIPNSSE
jgi:hypothetical protein